MPSNENFTAAPTPKVCHSDTGAKCHYRDCYSWRQGAQCTCQHGLCLDARCVCPEGFCANEEGICVQGDDPLKLSAQEMSTPIEAPGAALALVGLAGLLVAAAAVATERAHR